MWAAVRGRGGVVSFFVCLLVRREGKERGGRKGESTFDGLLIEEIMPQGRDPRVGRKIHTGDHAGQVLQH